MRVPPRSQSFGKEVVQELQGLFAVVQVCAHLPAHGFSRRVSFLGRDQPLKSWHDSCLSRKVCRAAGFQESSTAAEDALEGQAFSCSSPNEILSSLPTSSSAGSEQPHPQRSRGSATYPVSHPSHPSHCSPVVSAPSLRKVVTPLFPGQDTFLGNLPGI